MLNAKMINEEDLGLMHLTDSPRDAVDFILKTAYEDNDSTGNDQRAEVIKDT